MFQCKGEKKHQAGDTVKPHKTSLWDVKNTAVPKCSVTYQHLHWPWGPCAKLPKWSSNIFGKKKAVFLPNGLQKSISNLPNSLSIWTCFFLCLPKPLCRPRIEDRLELRTTRVAAISLMDTFFATSWPPKTGPEVENQLVGKHPSCKSSEFQALFSNLTPFQLEVAMLSRHLRRTCRLTFGVLVSCSSSLRCWSLSQGPLKPLTCPTSKSKRQIGDEKKLGWQAAFVTCYDDVTMLFTSSIWGDQIYESEIGTGSSCCKVSRNKSSAVASICNDSVFTTWVLATPMVSIVHKGSRLWFM